MTALISTVGASDSNSYCDVAFADTYFTDRVGSESWAEADKAVALIHATRIIDRTFTFIGQIDLESDQALRWPRSWAYDVDGRLIASDIVPTAVKQAVCELALYITDNKGYSAEVDSVKTIRVGPIRVDSNQNASKYSVPSTVQELLSGYGTFSGTVGGSSVRSVPVYRS